MTHSLNIHAGKSTFVQHFEKKKKKKKLAHKTNKTHLSVNFHVTSHVVLGGEQLLTQHARDVSGSLYVHVLHMLVEVGTVVGRIVALLAVVQLGLVREMSMVVNLLEKKKIK
jgi:hypothetical protein